MPYSITRLFVMLTLASAVQAQPPLDRDAAERLLTAQQRSMETRNIEQMMALMTEDTTLLLPDGQHVRKADIKNMLTAAFMNCTYVMFRPELLEFTPASATQPAQVRYRTVEKCLFQIEELKRVGVIQREYQYSLEPGPTGARLSKGTMLEFSREILGAY